MISFVGIINRNLFLSITRLRLGAGKLRKRVSTITNMEHNQFVIKLKQCLTSIFNEMDDKEDIFEFGISTDQDISTILIVYNTRTYFAAELEKKFLKEGKILSQSRWIMPEWYKEIGDGNSHLDAINNVLYNILHPRESEQNPETFKDILLDLLCQALLELKIEGLFNVFKGDPIIYLQQADSYFGSLMRARIKSLLSEKLYEDFLYDTRDDMYLHYEVYPKENL